MIDDLPGKGDGVGIPVLACLCDRVTIALSPKLLVEKFENTNEKYDIHLNSDAAFFHLFVCFEIETWDGGFYTRVLFNIQITIHVILWAVKIINFTQC